MDFETERPSSPELAYTPAEDVVLPEKPRSFSEKAVNALRRLKEKGQVWVEKAKQLADRARETVHQARTLDQELLINLPQNKGDLSHVIERIHTIETLSLGKELDKKFLGDRELGVNQTTVRTFDGHPPRKAFVKTSHGEAQHSKNGPLTWNENKLDFIEDPSDKHNEYLRQHFSHQAKPAIAKAIRASLAEKYGIKPEDVPYSTERFGYRVDVPPGESAIREYAVSRMDLLLGFDTVPLTILRTEQDDETDLCSVQERVASSRPDVPPRSLYKQESDILFDAPPSEWTKRLHERFLQNIHEERGAKTSDDGVEDLSDSAELVDEGEPQRSLMRIAALDYLVGSSDRHYGNILFDPASKKFHAIDNGLSFGMGRGADMSKLDENIQSFMHLRSLPIELTMRHTHMILDEEAREQVRHLYQELQTSGVASSITKRLFRMLFPKEPIARVEEQGFMVRLRILAETGRPPNEVGDELFAGNLLSRHALAEEKPPTIVGRIAA